MRYPLEKKLLIQIRVGRVMIFMLAPLVFLVIKCFGYRIRNLGQIRSECRKAFADHPGPWLICANHLTMIDSVILAYAMSPFFRYAFDYDAIPWNIPEKNNFQKNILSSFLCYVLKCIPICRRGCRNQVKSTLDKCIGLLKNGQRVMIFPEGTRSRTGLISRKEFPYGVGRLLKTVPDCNVLCLYSRGDHQTSYSDVPRYREVFTVRASVIRPVTCQKGLKAQRDIAAQIIHHLAEMEDVYFAEHRK